MTTRRTNHYTIRPKLVAAGGNAPPSIRGNEPGVGLSEAAVVLSKHHAAQLGRLATHLELTRIKHRRVVEDLVATSSPEERIKDIINQLFRKGNGGWLKYLSHSFHRQVKHVFLRAVHEIERNSCQHFLITWLPNSYYLNIFQLNSGFVVCYNLGQMLLEVVCE